MLRSSQSPGFGSSPGRFTCRSSGNAIALFLTAWLIYLADRLADAVSLKSARPLSAPGILPEGIARSGSARWSSIGGFDVYFIWRTIAGENFLAGAVVGILAVVYLVLNHPRGRFWRSLPAKEVAIGSAFHRRHAGALIAPVGPACAPDSSLGPRFRLPLLPQLHQHRRSGNGGSIRRREEFLRHATIRGSRPARRESGGRLALVSFLMAIWTVVCADFRLCAHSSVALSGAAGDSCFPEKHRTSDPSALRWPISFCLRRCCILAHRGGPVSFDAVAPWYRMLETIAFGDALQRCRVACLGEIAVPRRALIVGEGNGRFLCALLQAHPGVEVVCVDASERMLQLARKRMERRIARSSRPGSFSPSGHHELGAAGAIITISL